MGKNHPLGILQEIRIRLFFLMVYAQTGICHRKRNAYNSRRLCCSCSPKSENEKGKNKQIFWSYLRAEKSVVHENDGDNNNSKCTMNSSHELVKETGGTEDWKLTCDYTDHSIVKIGNNTKTSPKETYCHSNSTVDTDIKIRKKWNNKDLVWGIPVQYWWFYGFKNCEQILDFK